MWTCNTLISFCHIILLTILKKFVTTIKELLGLFWTLSIVLYVEDKKSHNISETGSVSVLSWMGQDKPTQLGPLERAILSHCLSNGPD
jgi:hypothetical protein